MAIPEAAFEAFEAFDVIPDRNTQHPLTEVAASTARVAALTYTPTTDKAAAVTCQNPTHRPPSPNRHADASRSHQSHQSTIHSRVGLTSRARPPRGRRYLGYSYAVSARTYPPSAHL